MERGNLIVKGLPTLVEAAGKSPAEDLLGDVRPNDRLLRPKKINGHFEEVKGLPGIAIGRFCIPLIDTLKETHRPRSKPSLGI